MKQLISDLLLWTAVVAFSLGCLYLVNRMPGQ